MQTSLLEKVTVVGCEKEESSNTRERKKEMKGYCRRK